MIELGESGFQPIHRPFLVIREPVNKNLNSPFFVRLFPRVDKAGERFPPPAIQYCDKIPRFNIICAVIKREVRNNTGSQHYSGFDRNEVMDNQRGLPPDCCSFGSLLKDRCRRPGWSIDQNAGMPLAVIDLARKTVLFDIGGGCAGDKGHFS